MVDANQAPAYGKRTINPPGYTPSYITYANGSVAVTSIVPEILNSGPRVRVARLRAVQSV